MKRKDAIHGATRIGITAIQAAILLAPVGVFAQTTTCLGGAVNIGTNCNGTFDNATVAALGSKPRGVGAIGNPASITSFAVDSFFNNAAQANTGIPISQIKAQSGSETSTEVGSKNWAIEIAAIVSKYDIDGVSAQRTSLPISYTIQSDIDPGRKLSFRLPVTRTTWGDNRSANAIGFGVDYRLPVTDAWSITPAASYTYSDGDEFPASNSFSGNNRSGTGKVLALGLTSVYNIDLGESSISIANMLGYASTKATAMDNAGTSSNNTMLRNGVMWTKPVTVMDTALGLQLSFIHNHYTSTELFGQNYTEFGVNLGSGKSAFATKDYWRAGLSFTKSDNTKGVSLTLGYWF